jgi:hypothetical protein
VLFEEAFADATHPIVDDLRESLASISSLDDTGSQEN